MFLILTVDQIQNLGSLQSLPRQVTPTDNVLERISSKIPRRCFKLFKLKPMKHESANYSFGGDKEDGEGAR